MAQALSAASVKTPSRKISAKKAPVKAKATNGSGKLGTVVPKPTTTGTGATRKQFMYTGKYPKSEEIDKTTPQIVALVDTAESAEKGEIDPSRFTAQELVALAVKKGLLSTRQDPLRIFRFYRKRLIDEGYFVEL